MRTLVAAVAAYAAFVLALPFLLLHPKVRDGVGERLGFFGQKRRRQLGRTSPSRPRVWLHGASAGDVLALLPLARELQAQDQGENGVQIFISTTTNSGQAICRGHAQLFAGILHFPYDLPGSIARLLTLLAPDVIVLEYTELWPQLLAAANRRAIPAVLHNGRFSGQRLGRYRLLFWFIGNIVARLRLLLMRDEIEAERAIALGAPGDRVLVTGNTKFDNVQPQVDDVERQRQRLLQLELDFGRTPRTEADSPLWVAGSTHEGEEALLLRVFGRARETTPGLRLLLAPRYIERTERVIQLIERAGFSYRRRSDAASDSTTADVLLLDTIGELGLAYGMADLVFVGGSFTNRGGHNLLEPAAWGKAVLFGPRIENVADSVQVLLGRGGIQVADESQLARVVIDLLSAPQTLVDLGAMAARQVQTVSGAARRNATEIWTLINPGG